MKKKSKSQKPSFKALALRLVFKAIGWLSLFTFLLTSGYAIFLDRTITSTFEGRKWSIPAQIYAQPLELHPNLNLSKSELTTILKRLGYRPVDRLQGPGTFSSNDLGLEIYLRAFTFIDKARNSSKIKISFSNNRLQRISSEGQSIPLIRLEPATIGSFFPSHGEDRIILSPEEVPKLLSEGLKSIEDREFDLHQGISLRGIFRAFLVNLESGEVLQGGSTLTQQLV